MVPRSQQDCAFGHGHPAERVDAGYSVRLPEDDLARLRAVIVPGSCRRRIARRTAPYPAVRTGNLPTDGALFASFLLGVIVIVGGLTYLPALALGPIIEHLQISGGTLY